MVKMISTLNDRFERKKNMADFELTQCEEAHKLCIKYKPQKTGRLAYGISDLDGRVLKTGDLQGEESEICIEKLKKGRYAIWVMDGDDMVRSNFEVA